MTLRVERGRGLAMVSVVGLGFLTPRLAEIPVADSLGVSRTPVRGRLIVFDAASRRLTRWR